MSKALKIATVFSGIGSFEFALKRMNLNYEIVFACDNGEREIEYNQTEEFEKIKSLDSTKKQCLYTTNLYNKLTRKTNFVEKSYLANFNCSKDRYYQDIKLIDGLPYKNKIDIFVGGSPCQSFSSVGYQHGLDDARGTLFYEFARLVKEIEPKVFIYENVRNLLNHDNGKTWEIIKGIFDDLGYKYDYRILNAADFGVPQTRRRLFVVGYKNGIKPSFNLEYVNLEYKMNDFLLNNCSFGNFCNEDGKIKIFKSSEKIPNEYFLTPKLYKYVMSPGTKNWRTKIEINKPIARTLLKTMGNHHRAGVDNYVSEDFSNDLGKVRILTEREALRLMGFTDDFKIVVSKAQAYMQAGNSIVVDVMISLIKFIIRDLNWGKEYGAKV